MECVVWDVYRNFEIILVNDGSSDGTAEKLAEFKEKTRANVQIITQENKGVSAARNAGMAAAQGKYIMFVDADDCLSRDYISRAIKYLDKESPDTVACYRIRDKESLDPAWDIRKVKREDPAALMAKFTYSKKKLGFMVFIYKREIIEENRLQFTEGAKYGEDWEFTTKYLAHCQTAIVIPYYMYYYRVGETSATRRLSYNQTDAIDAADRTSDYLDAMGHPFAGRYKKYMKNRAICSVAHRFARGNEKELYEKLRTEYDVKGAMKFLCFDGVTDVRTRLGAAAYLISPGLFYKIVKK